MHMYKELASSGDLSIEFRSNNIILIIIISGYSLSLESEEEEGNLFARWWADEVQYYVSK